MSRRNRHRRNKPNQTQARQEAAKLRVSEFDISQFLCKKQEKHTQHQDTFGMGLDQVTVTCMGEPLPPETPPVNTEQQPNPNPPETVESTEPEQPTEEVGIYLDPLPEPADSDPGSNTESVEIESNSTETSEIPAVEVVEPSLNEIVPLAFPGGFDAVPDGKMPFYVIAKDGLFSHIRNILGRVVIPSKHYPAHLPEIGKGGYLDYSAPKIPANICSMIVDFFTQVFEKHKTEAEVILLMHRETRQWGIMVPTQRTSYSAVDSRVDPLRVPADWLIVGTMHSHCDFGAFHSGTDTGDADDMNGVHFTIGQLDKEVPQIASMVVINKVRFSLKTEQLADFSDLTAAEAPEDWLRYVIPTSSLTSNHKPIGYNLFTQYPKPVKAVQKWTPPPYQYGQNTGGYGPNHNIPRGSGWQGNPGSWRDDNGRTTTWRDTKKTEDQDDSWAGWGGSLDGDDEAYYQYLRDKANPENIKDEDRDLPPGTSIWGEGLPDDILYAIVDSNCLTEDDIEAALDQEQEENPEMLRWWIERFIKKERSLADAMHEMGIDVEFSLKVCKSENHNKKK